MKSLQSFFLLLLIILFPSWTSGNNKKKTEVKELIHYDVALLNAVKAEISSGNNFFVSAYNSLISDANKELTKEANPVTNKTQVPPSGSKNDYLSLAPYWWPNPDTEDGLPYVWRDGKVNPSTRGDNTDQVRTRNFFNALELLSFAWYFSDDIKYVHKVVDLLNIWIVNSETRVNPHANFAQGIPGKNTGRKIGIIEWSSVYKVIVAMQMMEGEIPDNTKTAVNKWLSEWSIWLRTSEFGIEESAMGNNHGTKYDFQVLGLLIYEGKKAEAINLVNDFKTKRIAKQIEPDGKQPSELSRTKSVNYSTMNLWAHSQIAQMAWQLGVDLWDYESSDGRSIRRAYEFLLPYVLGEKIWTWEQITNGGREEALRTLTKPLFSRASTIFGEDLIPQSENAGDGLSYLDKLRYPPRERLLIEEDDYLRVADRHVCGTSVTFTYRGADVTYGTIERGGLCWMDRNLGASQVATSSTDSLAYGDLFQWGRIDDGHQVREPLSITTNTRSNNPNPSHSNYIRGYTNWYIGTNPNYLWKNDGTCINNPCPPGWRIPSASELKAELESWDSNDAAGAFGSELNWPVGGFRNFDGTLYDVGSYGYVHSSSFSGGGANYMHFNSINGLIDSGYRGFGMNVRCVRDKTKSTDLHQPKIVEQILIDSVWAANGVGFNLQTFGDMQFVAYYDANRMMSVASRKIDSNTWTKNILPNQLMWDSHNRVQLGIDKKGYIHVSGNMHVHPLAYFRSTKPLDVNSIEEKNYMVGINEEGVTYPNFFYNKEGDLLFSYRSGSCGNGNILVNRYLTEQGKWERYLDKPLFEGIEDDDFRAAYHRWVKDDNGDFHFVWMWRWTPMVETSHFIGYATTPDLKNWKNAAGETVYLPFRPDNPKVLVDDTPSRGGLHNGRYRITLTNEGEPIIGFVKYDEEGLTQLYLAKFINNDWKIKKISDWDFRWEFITSGAFMTIGAQFSFAGISDDGLLAIDWRTEKGESGRYSIDPKTLEHSDKVAAVQSKYPEDLRKKISTNPDLSVRTAFDNGGTENDAYRYVIKWEAAHGGFGQHAPEVIPDGPLSPLYLIKIK